MDIKLFDYTLPEELIAQRPAESRDGSKLLVYHRDTKATEHRLFSDIADYIRQGDVLVLNDSRVINARLIGVKESTGAAIELFLVKARPAPPGDAVWETLARPAKRLKEGDIVRFADDFSAVIIGPSEGGGRIVRFEYSGEFEAAIERLGRMPLPPYIKREADRDDAQRYQTVYAKAPGSVAAPTAGLHFTTRLLDRIWEKGAEIAFVTLHVGLGTFLPVKAEHIEEHEMHSEDYFISEEAAEVIGRAKAEGRRVICVGTTSVRTLESAATVAGGAGGTGAVHTVRAGEGSTDIFIYPGYKFKIADALITNFHLPKSTLMMLISALAGREEMLKVYEEAVSLGYRFFSYGDAMFIE
ncbi:MAG: tRNA preQ1(34) S-adenosylmethionine ribosyltransferase-isomerase QueA [Clostridiales Family XIII bacterium]|nr:tRNA preQ1(34) S-adenosylmethionine ribosyltransferase-isomerase QueA [Clostridiales Family XIII bacterium]